MTNRNILYRIFSESGELLYIGATTNPQYRIYDHSLKRPWWDEASEIKMQRLATLEDLYAAETEAIKAENPKYNLVHSKPAIWSRKPRRKDGFTFFQRSQDGQWVGGITVDGQRKRVSSRSREECERKLTALRAEYGLV